MATITAATANKTMAARRGLLEDGSIERIIRAGPSGPDGQRVRSSICLQFRQSVEYGRASSRAFAIGFPQFSQIP